MNTLCFILNVDLCVFLGNVFCRYLFILVELSYYITFCVRVFLYNILTGT